MGLSTSRIVVAVPSEQGSRCSIFPLECSLAYQPASPSRLHQACAAPAVPVSFGLGWRLRLVVS